MDRQAVSLFGRIVLVGIVATAGYGSDEAGDPATGRESEEAMTVVEAGDPLPGLTDEERAQLFLGLAEGQKAMLLRLLASL